MLLDVLDEVFGRRSSVRLLRALSAIDRSVSGREAARLAGLSHRAIISLDRLAALAIVTRREMAGQHLYSFNADHVLAGPVVELFAAERRRSAAILSRLGQLAEGCAVEYVGVFGSAARGEAEPGSDLDVLVVVRNAEARERAHAVFVEASEEMDARFGVQVSPVVVLAAQLREQAGDQDPFVQEVLRDVRRAYGPPLEDIVHDPA